MAWDDVPSLKSLGGVVSSRAVRPAVFFVRLLLVLRIAQWEEMKTSLVLNHQLFKNSELAQVLRNYVFGRYSQQRELRAKGTEVVQP